MKFEGQKIIVKIGSQVINGGEGLNKEVMAGRVQEMIELKRAGAHVLLVSSGAVAAGKLMRPDITPESLREIYTSLSADEAKKKRDQILFTLGQSKLMQTYASLLDVYGYSPAQGLLTGHDFNSPEALSNMRVPLDYAMRDKATLPIINANDLTDIEELMISDNDHLTALLAKEVTASRAIMLTAKDGLYDRSPDDEGAQLVTAVDHTVFDLDAMEQDGQSMMGRGGIRSKMKNALEMARHGTRVHIACGTRQQVISGVLSDTVPHTLVF